MSPSTRRPQALTVLATIVDRSPGVPTLRAVPEAEVRAVLARLDQLGDARAIPDLIAGVVGAPRASAALVDAAIATVEGLALRAAPTVVGWLDLALRRALAWPMPRERDWLARTTASSAVATMALAASHPDGRIRERAVRVLAGARDPRTLPFLLVRLDDWVAPVRAAAIAAVSARMTPAHAAALVASLPVLATLALRTRASEAKLVAWLRAWLREPEQSAALRAGLRHHELVVRREAFRLGAQGSAITVRTLIDVGLGDPDVVIRAEVAKLGAAALTGDEARWLAERLVRDRAPRLRSDGLARLATLDGAAARPALEAALFDRAESVHYTARYFLGKLGVGGLIERYRAALAAPGALVRSAALAGLAQLGGPEDVAAVARGLADDTGRVASAALAALTRLDRSAAHEAALGLLRDRRAGVARAAFVALHGAVRDGDLTALWAAVTDAPTARMRVRALTLVEGCSWWVALPALLQAHAHADPAVRDAARLALARWLRRWARAPYAAAPPSPARWRLVDAAFTTAAPALDRDHHRALATVLDAIRPPR